MNAESAGIPPQAPRVFFSFASEDGYWVKAFKTWFGSNIGVVHIVDYLAENLGYGALTTALDEQIRNSAVVLAFVSANYRRKEWTVAEWEKGLTEIQCRRLIFVPIMLDADAKVWWQDLRRTGKLGDLSNDYQYEDFSDGAGIIVDISPDDTRVTGRIARLAQKIRADLARPLAPAKPLAQEMIQPRRGIEPLAGEPDVVILGHPSAGFPPELLEHVNELIAALQTFRLQTQAWKDGWRRNAVTRGELELTAESDPIFVQPITEGEALERISDLGTIGKYLEEAGRANARVVLWLPHGCHEPNFEAAAAAPFTRFPVPRLDSPIDLAEWLRSQLAPADSVDALKIQIEGLGSPEDAKPEVACASKFIVDQLSDKISSIVSDTIDNPRPSPPPWQFWDTMFVKQMKKLPGSHAIVAIHDLDIAPGGTDLAVKVSAQVR